MSSHQPDKSKIDHCSWHTLGVKAERNKENNAVPAKWTSYKVLHINKYYNFSAY